MVRLAGLQPGIGLRRAGKDGTGPRGPAAEGDNSRRRRRERRDQGEGGARVDDGC